VVLPAPHVSWLKRTLGLTFLAAAVMGVGAVIAFGFAAGPASAHRSGCHRWHTCPSDLYTYRWHRLLCNSHHIDKIRVVYQRRTYWCHR
jgi:hypothetical protein